jgi:hypothetical protein
MQQVFLFKLRPTAEQPHGVGAQEGLVALFDSSLKGRDGSRRVNVQRHHILTDRQTHEAPHVFRARKDLFLILCPSHPI